SSSSSSEITRYSSPRLHREMPEDPSATNQEHNARVLGTDPALLASELEHIGAQKPGQRIMSSKASFLPIKLDGLACVAANVLKQEMLARGGDCAVHHDCLTLEREQTSVLLLATRAQYDDLLEKLRRQAFGLPEVAE